MNAKSEGTKDDVVATATSRAKLAVTTVIWIGLLSRIVGAQMQPAVPLKPTNAPPSDGAYDFIYRAGLVCGAGATTSPVTTKPTVQCGGTFTFPLPFTELEVGVMGPQASQSAVSGYLSTNLVIPLFHLRYVGNEHDVMLAAGGYTRMFETGHAVDYGIAYAHPVDDTHSIQFEVRDYCAFSTPTQHNVVFRVVWLVGIPD